MNKIMSNLNTRPDSIESPFIQLPLSLVDLLINYKRSYKTATKRFSALEAFFDLVKRHQLASLTQDASYLNGGLLDLARSWNWNRNDVKAFVKRLETLKIVELHLQGAKCLVTLTSLHGLQDLPSLCSEGKIKPSGNEINLSLITSTPVIEKSPVSAKNESASP